MDSDSLRRQLGARAREHVEQYSLERVLPVDDAGLLLDAINRAKTFYFENRWCWDEMVQRDMDKDVSWESSAKKYKGSNWEGTSSASAPA